MKRFIFGVFIISTAFLFTFILGDHDHGKRSRKRGYFSPSDSEYMSNGAYDDEANRLLVALASQSKYSDDEMNKFIEVPEHAKNKPGVITLIPEENLHRVGSSKNERSKNYRRSRREYESQKRRIIQLQKLRDANRKKSRHHSDNLSEGSDSDSDERKIKIRPNSRIYVSPRRSSSSSKSKKSRFSNGEGGSKRESSRSGPFDNPTQDRSNDNPGIEINLTASRRQESPHFEPLINPFPYIPTEEAQHSKRSKQSHPQHHHSHHHKPSGHSTQQQHQDDNSNNNNNRYYPGLYDGYDGNHHKQHNNIQDIIRSAEIEQQQRQHHQQQEGGIHLPPVTHGHAQPPLNNRIYRSDSGVVYGSNIVDRFNHPKNFPVIPNDHHPRPEEDERERNPHLNGFRPEASNSGVSFKQHPNYPNVFEREYTKFPPSPSSKTLELSSESPSTNTKAFHPSTEQKHQFGHFHSLEEVDRKHDRGYEIDPHFQTHHQSNKHENHNNNNNNNNNNHHHPQYKGGLINDFNKEGTRLRPIEQNDRNNNPHSNRNIDRHHQQHSEERGLINREQYVSRIDRTIPNEPRPRPEKQIQTKEKSTEVEAERVTENRESRSFHPSKHDPHHLTQRELSRRPMLSSENERNERLIPFGPSSNSGPLPPPPSALQRREEERGLPDHLYDPFYNNYGALRNRRLVPHDPFSRSNRFDGDNSPYPLYPKEGPPTPPIPSLPHMYHNPNKFLTNRDILGVGGASASYKRPDNQFSNDVRCRDCYDGLPPQDEEIFTVQVGTKLKVKDDGRPGNTRFYVQDERKPSNLRRYP